MESLELYMTEVQPGFAFLEQSTSCLRHLLANKFEHNQ